MKIASVIGARPQFIKHAPIQLELQKKFETVTVHTGQHYDANMSDIFFRDLKMAPPTYQLSLTHSSHGAQTGEMMREIEKIAENEKPGAILVYGDTNSTLAGALVAAKMHIPVIHIEAGLRSFNKSMPEEVNRILTDHISHMLFCPSDEAVRNLANEGITKNVFVSGDVMKDMLLLASPFIADKMGGKGYYFATIHRPYNTDDVERMRGILDAFQRAPLPVVFAVHPRTTARLNTYGITQQNYSNIIFVDPVGYFDSLSYQKFSSAVITDSGGMQKEAYWLKKKCITIRTETEWVETLRHNANTLVFDDLAELEKLLLPPDGITFDDGLYGDGKSAQIIVETIAAGLY